MKLKIFAGIALLAAVLITGSIILYGVFFKKSTPIFFLTYFTFSLLILILLVFMIKGMIKNNLALIFILGAAICLFMAVAASSIKVYNEKSIALDEEKPLVSHEIDVIQSQNKYYTEYMVYLEKQILSYKKSSQSLQAEIDANT